ncbi:DUF3105 domain-containing protein [Cohnella sp.]|uniref:DUF3105 domain-containing protein n=1 Tax=Cohnella sp. TaxID=1883426 RepID=UPI003567148E
MALLSIYISGFILLLSLFGYGYASKLNKENTSRLKKNEKAVLNRKARRVRLVSHFMLCISLLMGVVFLAQNFGNKYDIESLNYNVPIAVTEDGYYGADHTTDPVQYAMKIPTSGIHSPHDLKFGFYKNKPPYEELVHNLEHGDIIIYYRAEADSATLDQLEYLSKFREAGAGVLAVPNEDIPDGKEIVVTAWTHTMELPAFNEQAVGKFIYDFINKGPEQIPAGIRRGGGTM